MKRLHCKTCKKRTEHKEYNHVGSTTSYAECAICLGLTSLPEYRAKVPKYVDVGINVF